jgi:small-conductance mechanosensitive channel/CRP-like cAMP-binding protein
MARSPLRRRLLLPLAAIIFFALLIYFLPASAPPSFTPEQRNAYGWGRTIATVALWVSVMMLVVRAAGAVAFDLVFRARKGREAPRFVRDIFALAAYVLLTALILKSFFPELSLGALLSGSALLGIILGLALQDTLGNLFAGVSLQADKPFEVGDVITVGSWTGVVESITWRAVKIRTFTNHSVLISNSQIAKESIEVCPADRAHKNARLVFFNALYTDSPVKVVHVVREAVREAENVSREITPVVRVRNLGDFAVDYEIKYWLDDYARYNDTDALVRQLIWYAFRRAGLSFAYPTQTLYVERPAKPGERAATRLDRLTERLSAVDIFSPLTAEELGRLAASSASHTYAPAESIIRAGEAGDSMFVVNRGRVEVRINEGGRQRAVAELDEGDFFGEMALLTGEPRAAHVVAVEETEVLEIGHLALKQLFDANPDLVAALSHTVVERRAGLAAAATAETVEEKEQSVLSAVRRFFGLG